MSKTQEKKDYSKLIKVLQIATGVIMVALIVLGLIAMKKYNINAKNIPELSSIIQQKFGNGVIIISLIMIAINIIKSFALILPPAVVFSITAFILPNPFVSFIVNMISIIISMIVPYFLGRFTGTGMVDTLSKRFKAVKKVDDFAGTNEFKLTAVFKFSGIIPGDLSSLLFGAMNISFKNYMLGSTVGYAPIVFGYTLFGYFLKDVTEKPWVVSIPVIIVVSYIIIAGILTKKMIADNKKKQETV